MTPLRVKIYKLPWLAGSGNHPSAVLAAALLATRSCLVHCPAPCIPHLKYLLGYFPQCLDKSLGPMGKLTFDYNWDPLVYFCAVVIEFSLLTPLLLCI